MLWNSMGALTIVFIIHIEFTKNSANEELINSQRWSENAGHCLKYDVSPTNKDTRKRDMRPLSWNS